MDSFEWNKILGAILGTLLFLFIVKEAAHIIYPAEEEAEDLAYKVEMPETEAETGEEEEKQVDFGALLQQASADQGEQVARRCLQCHTFEKGGPHKTGPNLWGVLGSDIAAEPDFRYSNALSQMEGEWTYERVYDFVAAPSRYAPGTSMNFAGLRRQQQRIDLLAYLRTQADEPPALPEPLPEEEEAEETEEDAPEEEDASEAGTDGGAAAADGEGTTEEAAEDGETAADDGSEETAGNGDAETGESPEGEQTEPDGGGDAEGSGNADAEDENGESTG